MNKWVLIKAPLYLALALVLMAALTYGISYVYFSYTSSANLTKLGPEAPRLTIGGHVYRDLNKNGLLDTYEDARYSVEDRVNDLLSRMNLEEKVGLMFIFPAHVPEGGSLGEQSAPFFGNRQMSELIAVRMMNHFNIFARQPAPTIAKWHNEVQKLAERTRLGLPVTIASDPRHGFNSNPLAGMAAHGFSKWPEPLGLAATRDMGLVWQFADTARQEYLAIGIRLALHPLGDLATEPRWARISHTFGEDAELSARCTSAYIRGFQGKSFSASSVMCMTKHFPGAGPQKDGEDAHFPYGKEQVYPGNNFNYHLRPFEAAIAAGTGQLMTYYGMPVGLEDVEPVGFGFNRDVITGLLREKYGFDGVVCTDWHLLTPSGAFGFTLLPAKAWGVEELSIEERMIKALEAGVDQFGGEYLTDVMIQLVETGRITEARLDQSVRRLLRDKFRLGLFANPYVDIKKAASIVGNEAFVAAGALAQRKAYVLLKNGSRNGLPVLPLQKQLSLYIEGIDVAVAERYGRIVDSVEDAEVAIVRLTAPHEARSGLMERLFHAGDLEFKGEERERLLALMNAVPTIVDVFMERPAVLPEIAEHSAGLLANFGATDEAALAVIFGEHNPGGKLPFELPSSMDAVRKQREDMPYDSEDALFPFGYGLSYTKESNRVQQE